jgi:NAD+ kinase
MNVAVPAQPPADVADGLATTIASIEGLQLGEPAAADVLLAVDDAVLRAAVDSDDSRPLLRLAATADETTADRSTLLSRLATHAPTAVPTTSRRILSVTAAATTTRAASDCAIVTTDPARISEYRVVADGATLTTFRADGVVVATPLGTATYSRAAGGPRLAADTGLAVVPIAPFAMSADQWVVRPPLTLQVARDDDVGVFADGRHVASGGGGLTASVTVAGTVTVVDQRRLGAGGRNWKNSNESSPHD